MRDETVGAAQQAGRQGGVSVRDTTGPAGLREAAATEAADDSGSGSGSGPQAGSEATSVNGAPPRPRPLGGAGEDRAARDRPAGRSRSRWGGGERSGGLAGGCGGADGAVPGGAAGGGSGGCAPVDGEAGRAAAAAPRRAEPAGAAAGGADGRGDGPQRGRRRISRSCCRSGWRRRSGRGSRPRTICFPPCWTPRGPGPICGPPRWPSRGRAPCGWRGSTRPGGSRCAVCRAGRRALRRRRTPRAWPGCGRRGCSPSGWRCWGPCGSADPARARELPGHDLA